MKLTPHFTLEEFIRSGYAERNNIDNTPSNKILVNLSLTALRMEDIRIHLNSFSVIITSGYRCLLVNKGIGGSPTSAHLEGFAADFVCPKFGTPLEICRHLAASNIKFDQLIQEGTWVHISFDPRMRQQILTKVDTGYTTGL